LNRKQTPKPAPLKIAQQLQHTTLLLLAAAFNQNGVNWIQSFLKRLF
jgi:hypothetical protein